ncbi:MAG: hypothetical protein ACRC5C_07065 [Bacilli bacterium]
MSFGEIGFIVFVALGILVIISNITTIWYQRRQKRLAEEQAGVAKTGKKK